MTALQSVEVRGHEVKRRTESARTACLMLAAVTPVFWFSACSGGGGGSSTPNPASVAQVPEITITPPANRTSQSQQHIPSQTQLAVQERQIETITTPVQEPPTVPVQQPENTITDLLIRKQDVQDREFTMRISFVPEDGEWSGIDYDIDPIDAGNMCCYQSYVESVYLGFECLQGYYGDVTITVKFNDRHGHAVRESVPFTCR